VIVIEWIQKKVKSTRDHHRLDSEKVKSTRDRHTLDSEKVKSTRDGHRLDSEKVKSTRDRQTGFRKSNIYASESSL
jgi:hypothetical protein